VLGVDASTRFIGAARHEALQSSTPNVRFVVAGVETSAFAEQFDLAFSRFGTMFFANPVAALGNVRRSLVPGGRLVMVVWRAKVENDWLYRAQTITERFVAKPEQYDAPTCGPGPFSMANANTTSGVLKSAGFEEITLRRCDLPITIGRDIDEAVKFVMDVGPAGEILRLAAAHLHKPVADALREGLADWAAGLMASSPPDRHGSSPPTPPPVEEVADAGPFSFSPDVCQRGIADGAVRHSWRRGVRHDDCEGQRRGHAAQRERGLPDRSGDSWRRGKDRCDGVSWTICLLSDV
jgi:hypothetical protein